MDKFDAPDTTEFRKNGYQLISSVFTEDEISTIRENAYLGREHRGDVLSHPYLHSVLMDERIIAIAREFLGCEPVYFGDSSCNFNGPVTSFHKDNADRYDIDGPDWHNGPYSTIRIGLYLQDHTKHAEGLAVRHQSHEHSDWHTGEARYVDTSIGDLAVWLLTTTHRGMVSVLADSNVPLDRGTECDVQDSLKLPNNDSDRIAIFMAFGAPSANTQRFIDYLRTRSYAIYRWEMSEYSQYIKEAAQKNGLIVDDYRERVLKQDMSLVHELHHKLPYISPFEDANQ